MKIKLFVLSLILIIEALATGILPTSRGDLFTALTNKSNIVWYAIGVYFLNYFFIDISQSFKAYAIRKVSLDLRHKRTVEIVTNHTINNNVTNIPQRIQEDIKLSYHSRITVWCEYFVSGTILLQLIIINKDQPLLLGAALLYSLISIFIATRFNPKLTAAEMNTQQAEADFRTSLLDGRFSLFLLPKTNTIVLYSEKVRMYYFLFTKLQSGLLMVLPYIVLIPQLYSNKITLGILMQHSASFGLLVVNACIILNLYTTLIQGKASEERVKELYK